jgi:hypothetical protein
MYICNNNKWCLWFAERNVCLLYLEVEASIFLRHILPFFMYVLDVILVIFCSLFALMILSGHVSFEFKLRSRWGVLDTTLCDQVCQWLATGQWFYPSTLVSSTNKTDRHDITEIFLKVTLNTINQPNKTMWTFAITLHCRPQTILINFRPGELLPSLFVRRPSVNISHFNLLKPLGQLQPNFGGMVFGWPPSKFVFGDPDFQPRWPPS